MKNKNVLTKQKTFKLALFGSALLHLGVLFGLKQNPPEITVSFTNQFAASLILEQLEKKQAQTTNKGAIKEVVENKPIEKVEDIAPLEKTKEIIETAHTEKSLIKNFEETIIQFPPPNYPLMARRRGQEGHVTLELFIDQDGSPSEVLIKESSGHQLLDQAALSAAKKWRFRPLTHLQIAYYTVEKTIEFKLQ